MTNKMGLMALGLSVALLSGCSSDNDTTDPVTTETAATETAATETAATETATTETATTETAATASGFTPELLVGKTYLALESTGFESTLTITESGIYNDVDDIIYPYTIDASGALVFEDGFFINITSIDENGDLHVIDSEGTTGVWVLVS